MVIITLHEKLLVGLIGYIDPNLKQFLSKLTLVLSADSFKVALSTYCSTKGLKMFAVKFTD